MLSLYQCGELAKNVLSHHVLLWETSAVLPATQAKTDMPLHKVPHFMDLTATVDVRLYLHSNKLMRCGGEYHPGKTHDIIRCIDPRIGWEVRDGAQFSMLAPTNDGARKPDRMWLLVGHPYGRRGRQ